MRFRLSTGLTLNYLRKENQLQQKKKDEEAEEKAVRRVYVVPQASNMPFISDRTNTRTTQSSDGFFDVPATQYGTDTTVSSADRYQLHQLQSAKQTGADELYDGLSIRKVHVRLLETPPLTES